MHFALEESLSGQDAEPEILRHEREFIPPEGGVSREMKLGTDAAK